jgi:hypothetical protein
MAIFGWQTMKEAAHFDMTGSPRRVLGTSSDVG